MMVLLTNDDGIFAPGIKALWQALMDIADVYVAAPATEQSAKSQAITVHDPIRVDEYVTDDNITAWKIGGTPTDCIKVALEVLLKETPDLVISGINRGPNLGTDVLYSGTVGAALEGGMKGIRSIALSLNTRENDGFGEAAKFAAELVKNIDSYPIKPGMIWNINFPKAWQLGDAMAVTTLGKRDYVNLCEPRKDPSGRTYYWLGGKLLDIDKSAGTDIGEAEQGKATITPLQIELTDFKAAADLRKWWNDNHEK